MCWVSIQGPVAEGPVRCPPLLLLDFLPSRRLLGAEQGAYRPAFTVGSCKQPPRVCPSYFTACRVGPNAWAAGHKLGDPDSDYCDCSWAQVLGAGAETRPKRSVMGREDPQTGRGHGLGRENLGRWGLKTPREARERVGTVSARGSS